MIRRKRPPQMLIINIPQPLPIPLHIKSCIQTTPALIRLVTIRPMRQHTPKEQDIARLQRHRGPDLCTLPCGRDPAALRKLDLHAMRPRDDFETAVCEGGGVDGDVGCEMWDLADVAVGVVVDVCEEAVSVGEFVVDFIFEEGCFLHLLVLYRKKK